MSVSTEADFFTPEIGHSHPYCAIVPLYYKPCMMKTLLAFLLISISVFAQHNRKKWDQVIDFENEGRIQSAYALVKKIQNRAERQKNETELIKCFFY